MEEYLLPDFDINSIFIAVSSLIVSGLTALLTFLFTRKKDREIEELKNNLGINKDEKSARRAYEYESKKRIYQKFEPLLFQFNELAGDASRRIAGFSREAKKENLITWLSSTEGYYFKNSIYRLFSPLAIFKLMQNELTLVDLNLEPNIRVQYMLIKALYHTFSDDFQLAKSEPKLEYDPYSISNYEMDNNYKGMQGIFQGSLDQLVDLFIIQETVDNNLRKRIISFGEFENKHNEIKTSRTFQNVIELFSDFHPETKPVLWRILLAQFHIYKAIMLINNNSISEKEFKTPLKILSNSERLLFFDWRSGNDNIVNTTPKVIEEPYIAIRNYFKMNEYVSKLVDDTVK